MNNIGLLFIQEGHPRLWRCIDPDNPHFEELPEDDDDFFKLRADQMFVVSIEGYYNNRFLRNIGMLETTRNGESAPAWKFLSCRGNRLAMIYETYHLGLIYGTGYYHDN